MLNKTLNDYATAGGFDLLQDTPKAVWAAIAVSLATQGGDRLTEARALILAEWEVLHANGIVPQKPPTAASEARKVARSEARRRNTHAAQAALEAMRTQAGA